MGPHGARRAEELDLVGDLCTAKPVDVGRSIEEPGRTPALSNAEDEIHGPAHAQDVRHLVAQSGPKQIQSTAPVKLNFVRGGPAFRKLDRILTGDAKVALRIRLKRQPDAQLLPVQRKAEVEGVERPRLQEAFPALAVADVNGLEACAHEEAGVDLIAPQSRVLNGVVVERAKRVGAAPQRLALRRGKALQLTNPEARVDRTAPARLCLDGGGSEEQAQSQDEKAQERRGRRKGGKAKTHVWDRLAVGKPSEQEAASAPAPHGSRRRRGRGGGKTAGGALQRSRDNGKPRLIVGVAGLGAIEQDRGRSGNAGGR